MEENNTYAIVGGMGLLALSGLSLPTIPLLPIGIGVVGLGSLYGCYMIATKEEREKKRVLEEKKDELERFFIGAGIKNKEGETPILANIWETDNGHIYSFINPIGMSTHDYDSKDIAIKEFLNCKDVLFEIKNDFLNLGCEELKTKYGFLEKLLCAALNLFFSNTTSFSFLVIHFINPIEYLSFVLGNKLL